MHRKEKSNCRSENLTEAEIFDFLDMSYDLTDGQIEESIE